MIHIINKIQCVLEGACDQGIIMSLVTGLLFIFRAYVLAAASIELALELGKS